MELPGGVLAELRGDDVDDATDAVLLMELVLEAGEEAEALPGMDEGGILEPDMRGREEEVLAYFFAIGLSMSLGAKRAEVLTLT